MLWKFSVYFSGSGRSDTQRIIDQLDVETKIAFAVRVRYLANTLRKDWIEPQAKRLQGERNIYEIRFKARQLQCRPLGYFGPGEKQFTILIWCTHKQQIYFPPDAIKTAARRRSNIDGGRAYIEPLKIDGEVFPEP
jgi:hypothetical protein